MISDSIKNIDLYKGLSERLDKAFDYIKTCDFSKLNPGKYEIDGKNIYYSISTYETKPLSEGKWEAHKNYIDIQYIIDGEECMGFAQTEEMNITVDYNEEKDIFFGTCDGSFVKVKKGEFVVFMPQDAHMPNLMSDNKQSKVTKAVFKILV